MNNKINTAIVVGANGIIGTKLIEYLTELGDWNVIGLSRKGGKNKRNLEHISVDLLNRESSLENLSHLTEVTHIFYTAYQERPTWAELVAPNLAMLINVVDAIEPVAKKLRHISLMQGYKVYGAHLGTFKTPAKESDAGHMPPEFNVDQQNFLEERQKDKLWNWSAIRPSVVGSTSLGNPMNLALVIAIYASVSKELSLPLRFPGKPGAYDKLMEVTDAGLLAKATVWAATNPECANQAFNINNGDLFRWNDLWPKIALYFGLEVAPHYQCHCKQPWQTRKIFGDLYRKSIVWQNILMRHCQAGVLAILCFPGITTFSRTEQKHALPVSMNMLIPRRCFIAFLMILREIILYHNCDINIILGNLES